MRYYVVGTIQGRSVILGEVVETISGDPREEPPYRYAHERAANCVGSGAFPADLEPRPVAEHVLRGEPGGPQAIEAWRSGDDEIYRAWAHDDAAAALLESTREDLTMFARNGDRTAALLLREGSSEQQRDYIDAEAQARR